MYEKGYPFSYFSVFKHYFEEVIPRLVMNKKKKKKRNFSNECYGVANS